MKGIVRFFHEKVMFANEEHPQLRALKRMCLILTALFFMACCMLTVVYLLRYQARPASSTLVLGQDASPSSTYSAVVFSGETGDPHNVGGIQAYFDSFQDGVLSLQICNINRLDAWLVSIQDEDAQYQYTFAPDTCLPALADSLIYETYSFEGVSEAFVAALPKTTITYMYDDGIERSVSIFPYAQSNDTVYNGTAIRTQDNKDQFDFIIDLGDTVQFEGQNITIDEPLFIPAGKQLKLMPGQSINLINNAYIVLRCPIQAIGTSESGIRFYTGDGTGRGVFVCQSDVESTLSYVTFDGLDTPKSGIWGLTGAVTFYESDVSIDHCAFINNICEDGLNIVRSNFNISGTTFENIYQDAFDSDFSDGTITDCVFRNTGNDGVDVSTSEVTVSDTRFYNIGDKGISGGEKSHLTIYNITVETANIGLASKDLSLIEGSNITVRDVTFGVALYQKKPEYGPATISIHNFVLLGSVSLDYLIQKDSMLYIDGEYVEPTFTVKINLLIEKIINEEPIQ